MEDQQTKYFGSRTEARNFARDTKGYKFVDQGADAEKGKRWSAVPELGAQVKATRAKKAEKKAKTGDAAHITAKDQAIAIVSEMIAKGEKRKAIIDRMCSEIRNRSGELISTNCASTYYQNVKLGRWKAA